MNYVRNVFSAAMAVPDGTDQAEAAKVLCSLRQRDPYAPYPTPVGVLMAWQGMIFEATLAMSVAVLV